MDITIRWAGAADAAAGSLYKIERTLDMVSWATLADEQASTAPYSPVSSTLNGNVSFGATSVVLTDGGSFGSSGYAWLEDALIQWTGKGANTLTGVTWHSGYGTYSSGSVVYNAHESYVDTGVTIANNAALYRISHINSSGSFSAPAYLWYYSPPVPASSAHCVVITSVGADLGVEPASGVLVSAYLVSDSEFSDAGGQHLNSGASESKTVATNALGLAFHHCWKNSARGSLSETDSAYTFILDDAGEAPLTVMVGTIPDRDWALLSHVATSFG